MTVCIAALINWIYPPNNEIGRAVIAVADRMLTAGDIEYEPPQFKIAFLRQRIAILVSGDIVVHSEALTQTQKNLARNPQDDVESVARIYASAIRDIKNKRSSEDYLEPIGLDGASFIALQKDMEKDLVFDLSSRLQNYQLNVEALVAGCDDRLSAHIFHIDGCGRLTFQHDINFAAIGIGANHAKSQFMFSRYPKIVNFYQALPILYTAKRRAEVAPGVGSEADWILITRGGIEFIYTEMVEELKKSYNEFLDETRKRLEDVGKRLSEIHSNKIRSFSKGAGLAVPREEQHSDQSEKQSPKSPRNDQSHEIPSAPESAG